MMRHRSFVNTQLHSVISNNNNNNKDIYEHALYAFAHESDKNRRLGHEHEQQINKISFPFTSFVVCFPMKFLSIFFFRFRYGFSRFIDIFNWNRFERPKFDKFIFGLRKWSAHRLFMEFTKWKKKSDFRPWIHGEKDHVFSRLAFCFCYFFFAYIIRVWMRWIFTNIARTHDPTQHKIFRSRLRLAHTYLISFNDSKFNKFWCFCCVRFTLVCSICSCVCMLCFRFMYLLGTRKNRRDDVGLQWLTYGMYGCELNWELIVNIYFVSHLLWFIH